MAEEAPLWEASKENAAPLERGRNVHVLERSLQMETAQERQEKEKQLEHYEKLLLVSSSQQDDPLIHWLSYIKFHQEAYPSDTHAQFLLMERCTRALMERKEYANDVRFIQACVKYADKTGSPGDVFKHLHQSKVGSKVALFWMAWAWVAESKGDFEFANKVFLKGIAKNAMPIDKLKQRHKQFQRRFAKHLLKEREEGEMNDEQESRRGRLAGLSEDRVRRNDRSIQMQPEPATRRRPNPPSFATFTDRSVASRSAADSNNSNEAASFPIFVDDSEHDAGYNLDQSYADAPRDLEREVDRKKENAAAAERWNDRGGLGSGSFQMYPQEVAAAPASTGLSFDVYMDEECAAKLEREKRKRHTEAERARRDRDERTLRQHEEGMAEKLARDPMRYVRNPSKLATGQGIGDNRKDPPKVEKSQATLTCGFNKRLVTKGTDGQEQCFEEGRVQARYYRLACDRFNLLEVAQADDSTMDVSVESMNDGDRKPPALNSHKKLPPRSLFSGDDSMENNMNNISTASSTVNERHAVGVATGKEEETINTKLAMKELSMMFSSPAMGLNDLEQPVEEEDGDTATFSFVAGLVDEHAANNSILAGYVEGEYLDENDENFAPRNPEARDMTTPGFHQSALRTLEGEDRVVEPVTFSVYEDDAPFPIYEDGQSSAAASFQIHNDERDSGGDTATFSVFHDTGQSTLAAPFSIYEDRDERAIEGATATFSVFEKVGQSAAAAPFSIYEDRAKRDSGGDTASFSVFGEVLKILDEPPSAAAGFPINMDDDSVNDIKTDDFKKFRPQTATTPEFGDISRIVVDDCDLPPFRRSEPPKVRQSDVLGVKASLDYRELHKNDIRLALRKVQVEAREMACSGAVRPRDSNLTRLLCTKGYMDSLPEQSVPRALLQMTSAKGSKITLGDKTGFVKEELGRGSYGKVVLIESKEEDDDDVNVAALKAQAPLNCLALEYVILKAIQERVEPHCRAHFPYPRALSFVSLANGGLLGMTHGSQSGLNLVDLANVYKMKEGVSVPELVVIHYTIRMLKHIEALHWHGKILHCDAKPDNWVLSASDSSFDGCKEVIEGSELMLVDFGRAVDLKAAAKPGIDPMDVRLEGSCAEKDMECVAMRKRLSWSFDIDTFGVCASAHVLLYGSHIEIDFSSTAKRWKPRKPLRRYWQIDLWNDLFDTFLNLDEVSQTALGSHPRSLRALYKKMETYMRDRSSKLESLLKHQARMLPSVRIT